MALAKNKGAGVAKPATTKPEVKKAAVKPTTAPKAPAPAAETPEVEVAGATLSRKDLAATIREKVMASGGAISPKVAETVTVAFEEALAEALSRGDKVSLPGFGTFSVGERAARTGKNPKTGEAIEIAACRVPKFKPGSKLKALVNGGEEAAGEEAEGE